MFTISRKSHGYTADVNVLGLGELPLDEITSSYNFSEASSMRTLLLAGLAFAAASAVVLSPASAQVDIRLPGVRIGSDHREDDWRRREAIRNEQLRREEWRRREAYRHDRRDWRDDR